MHFVNRVTYCAVPLILVMAFNAAGTEYGVFTGFPKAAPGAFGVKAEGLPDGRWVVWNGDAVFLETMAGGDEFKEVASGYAGDPGFMAISPDGHTVLLGAGMSGKLYRFDVRTPVNYTPDADLGVVSHYWGTFLTDTLVAIDKLTDDDSTDEIVIIDISKADLARKSVMLKPAASEVPDDDFAASAALAVDATRTYMYAMEVIFNSSWIVVANPLKRVAVSYLINAYNTDTLLNWTTHAAPIVGPLAFLSGGPAYVMDNGDLLVVGYGGVQRVDPTTGTVIETIDPAGPFEYYGVAYNPRTGVVLPIVAEPGYGPMDVVYAPEGAFVALPAVSGFGLLALAAMLAVAGAGRVASRRIR